VSVCVFSLCVGDERVGGGYRDCEVEEMSYQSPFHSAPILMHAFTDLNKRFNDVTVLDLGEDFYQEDAPLFPCPASIALQLGCATADRSFHSATDVALRTLVAPCHTCTHVLLTDVGHGYSSSFLKTALAYPQDLVMASYYRQGKPVVAEVKPGTVDIAAVLMRHHVMESDGDLFLHSFPRGWVNGWNGLVDGWVGGWIGWVDWVGGWVGGWASRRVERTDLVAGRWSQGRSMRPFAIQGMGWREGHYEDYLFIQMAVDDGLSLVMLSDKFLVHAF